MTSDFIGSVHGQFQVVERDSAKNKKVYWKVQCLACNHYFVLATDTIKKNMHGCQDCTRRNAPKGNQSIYWRGGKHISAIFLSNVKRGAKKRGIPCEVTIQDLDKIWELQEGRCAYTNRQLSLRDDCTASLDRIDSSIGYIKSNVQFVHKTVNVMKWALSEEEFFDFVREIYDNVWVSEDGSCLHKKQLSGVQADEKFFGHLGCRI